MMRRLHVQIFLMGLFILLFANGAKSNSLETKGRMVFTTQSEKARSLFAQGLVKYDRAELRAATPFFQQSIEADPTFAMGQLFRGLAGDSNPHIRKAAELVEKISEPERLFIQSWNAQLESQIVKAVEYAERATKLLPDEPRLRLRLAQMYNATGKRDAAITDLTQAIQLDAKFAPAYAFLGQVYIARGDFAKALETREAYARIIPDAAEPYQAIAHTYQQMQKFDQAVEYYNRALKIDPDYINVYRRRGDARFFARDVAGARADYQAGLKRAKGADRPGLLYAAAFTYVHEGQIDEAAKFYEQAINEASEIDEALMVSSGWDALGRSYLEAGRLIEAARAYRNGYDAALKSSKFTEQEKVLWTGRYHHARGRILAKIGEFDAAMEQAEWIRSQIDKAGNPNPGYLASYHYLVGYILLEKRDYKSALDHLKKASTDDMFIKLLLARAYSALGEKAAAEKFMKEIANYTLGSVPASIARPEALRWLQQNQSKP
jgi:tetratricopeptide (TPR) repeat protein